MDKLIKQLRLALYDNNEPYIYSEDDLWEALNQAAAAYSKYNPVKRQGVINVLRGVTDYELPADYQTWVWGLSDFEVFGGRAVLKEEPSSDYNAYYTYLAVRGVTEIPAQDYPLITGYCFYSIISGQIKEQAEISSIKLGQGLQIQFSDTGSLLKLAESKLTDFNNKLAKGFGGWS